MRCGNARANRRPSRYRGEMIDRLVASACIEAVLESNIVFAPQATDREILVAQIVVNATLTEGLGLDAIALRFAVSRRQLTSIFREATGGSITDYQIRRHVECTAALLHEPATTALDAAMAVEIESTSYLTCLFELYGMGKPGRYKIGVRNHERQTCRKNAHRATGTMVAPGQASC